MFQLLSRWLRTDPGPFDDGSCRASLGQDGSETRPHTVRGG